MNSYSRKNYISLLILLFTVLFSKAWSSASLKNDDDSHEENDELYPEQPVARDLFDGLSQRDIRFLPLSERNLSPDQTFSGLNSAVIDRAGFNMLSNTPEEEIPTLKIIVSRENAFKESLEIVNNCSFFKEAQIEIEFIGEPALDYGGVLKEWFTELWKKILDPATKLFRLSPNKDSYEINPDSDAIPDYSKKFIFVGKILGKAFVTKNLLPNSLSRPILKYLLDESKPVTLADVEKVDSLLYKNLGMLDQSENVEDLSLTFSYSFEKSDKIETVERKDSDNNTTDVTNVNKKDYIDFLIKCQYRDVIQKQLEMLRQGFNEIVDPALISSLDESKLDLLVTGLPTIDVDEWQKYTKYIRTAGIDLISDWFWETVRSYNQEQLRKLLKFVTGSSRVPSGGFANLRSEGVRALFNIFVDENVEPSYLPRAQTCFNRIELPFYESQKDLQSKLTYVIENTDEGLLLS